MRRNIVAVEAEPAGRADRIADRAGLERGPWGTRWRILLECGHTIWLTMQEKPLSTTLHCERCSQPRHP